MQQTVIPQLRMTDATVSVPFYQQLGFTIDWEHRFAPDMPLFVQIRREGQLLFLTEHAGDCEPGGAVYFMCRTWMPCMPRLWPPERPCSARRPMCRGAVAR